MHVLGCAGVYKVRRDVKKKPRNQGKRGGINQNSVYFMGGGGVGGGGGGGGVRRRRKGLN